MSKDFDQIAIDSRTLSEEKTRHKENLAKASEYKLKLLLVEDNADDEQLFRAMLRRSGEFGCDIHSVKKLSAAEQTLKDNHYDLIILDLNLPDSSGIVTYLSLSELVSSPVIIFSGADDLRLAIHAVSHGAQDYIIKGETDTQALTRSVHFALERAKRLKYEKAHSAFQKELDLIENIQKILLPERKNQAFKNAEISAVAQPAYRASGDYCDIVRISETSFFVFVADVSGHGIEASQLMLCTRATLLALASQLHEPSEIVTQADKLLLHDFHSVGHFVTLLVGKIDTAAGTFTYTSAGHAGYHFGLSGDLVRLPTQTHPLGMMVDLDREVKQTRLILETGDLLVLPTDGLIETSNKNKELYGLPRVKNELLNSYDKTSLEIVETLKQSVTGFAAGELIRDDISIMVMKYLI